MKDKTVTVRTYERLTFLFDAVPCPDSLIFETPDGKTESAEAFTARPITFSYDDDGFETVNPIGELHREVRYFAAAPGSLRVKAMLGDTVSNLRITAAMRDMRGLTLSVVPVADADVLTLTVSEGMRRGYVMVSKRDPRYFALSDGTSFMPVGINLAFISPVAVNNGHEFGQSGKFRYFGMRHYERWLRVCALNGVNFVRVWVGHSYFNPDTETAGEFRPEQFAKIDALVAMAERYGIRLKLTLEQFRYFNYTRVAESNSYEDDVFRKFNKRLSLNGVPCPNVTTFLQSPEYRDVWMRKVREFAARYAGDPTVAVIELWNEMNCLPYRDMLDWNRVMLPAVKARFPRQLVTNSLGSYCSDGSRSNYEEFCWDACDIYQIHRYLDRGAEYEICHDSPIDLIRDGVFSLKKDDKPFFVAETGAVNHSHSGPFSYYAADHRGILFADLVYTPLFCGCAGCGHIWHWDERYVESKNLYRYFRPLADLTEDIPFDTEDFVPDEYRTDDVIVQLLRGKTVTLGYIRNRHDTWQLTLRDLGCVPMISSVRIPRVRGTVRTYPVFDGETVTLTSNTRGLTAKNLLYGILFRVTNAKKS